jgi:type II secretion system (T2SS) protein E
MMSVKPLGELLIEGGFIDKELLKYALALKEKRLHVDKLGRILVNLNYIDEDILVEFLGKQRGAPGINLRKKEIDEGVINIVSRDIAEKYNVIPIGFKLNGRVKKLIVAMADPSNLDVIDTIVFITGYTVEPVFAREEDLKWTIKYYYNKARILLKGRSN